MIRRLLKSVLVCLLAGGVLLGLGGCSNLKADIPQHIVSEAVSRQAQQEQSALWQQLSSTPADAPTLSVNRVKVEQVRRVKVASDLAYEVTGTYNYKLRYPNRPSVKQSQVPFDLFLRGSTEIDDWQLLQRGIGIQGDRAWHWQGLGSDRA
jgi:hypothetical protein